MDLLEQESESSSFEIQIPRGGKLRVNSIPLYLSKFREILEITIPVLANDLDPKFRQRNFNVTFLPRIVDKEGVGREVLHFGGVASVPLENIHNPDIEITLSLRVIQDYPPNIRSIGAVVRLLHEIFEANFWFQSQRLKDQPIKASFQDEIGYWQADHELIADRKSVACLQKALGAQAKLLENGQMEITTSWKYEDYI